MGYFCTMKPYLMVGARDGKVVQRMTDKDIQEAVENCFWRKKVAGIYVCSGEIVPCEKHIDDGKCPTLIELFAKERGTDDE